jgi:hypothetical protein
LVWCYIYIGFFLADDLESGPQRHYCKYAPLNEIAIPQRDRLEAVLWQVTCDWRPPRGFVDSTVIYNYVYLVNGPIYSVERDSLPEGQLILEALPEVKISFVEDYLYIEVDRSNVFEFMLTSSLLPLKYSFE